MADTRAVKFCTQRDYIKSCQMDETSAPKGAWFGSRDSFFSCATEDLDEDIKLLPWHAIM